MTFKKKVRRVVKGGWLDGARVRTARKEGRCQYWRGLLSGGRCPNIIKAGDRYVEGEGNDSAGGFGVDRYCLDHLNADGDTDAKVVVLAP